MERSPPEIAAQLRSSEDSAASSGSPLAILEGPKAVSSQPAGLFAWPIITHEEEEAVLEVLRRGAMSGTDITLRFEEEFRQWQSCRYALAYNTGTSALEAAMFAAGFGAGHEVICPSVTYWATVLPLFSVCATPVFADVCHDSVCIDPADIEHRITEHSRGIMVTHNMSYPAEMDAIMDIADRHGLIVIEDCSHAQGGLCRGRRLGTFGQVNAASLMSGKSLVAGEAGMLWTDDKHLYDRALAWGHYNRFHPESVDDEELKRLAGLPLGGIKGRVHQLSSAVGRVQLRYYDERCREIRKAMNAFWDMLEGVHGIRAHRPHRDSGSNMAGWYSAHGHYRADELGGLSVSRFAQAVRAEGSICEPGCNLPLHLHPLLRDADPHGIGKPKRLAYCRRSFDQLPGSLPVSEAINSRVFRIPRFVRFNAEAIAQHADAFRKVAENYQALLADDPGNPEQLGSWGLTSRSIS